ncbi:MAG: DegT/DnrJ/EryC1/StrS family aminotransferase [Bacteroidetes bacterium]|nr:DegT/DnrJ/EryC1/StrS family aminotransferase [Bacteroidota bacterium]
MIEYENLHSTNSPFFKEFSESFEQALNSGWFILGEGVQKFESEFSKFLGSKFTIGVNSGLDALTFSLKALNLPHNSEVIVPSNTYIATILSILQCHLIPVLVEPNISTYNIDPDKIEEKITSNTKAIIVVHLYGKSCDMDKIVNISNKYNLPIIEDCAQSHGAKFKKKLTGTFGTGAFSFYPTKNLGALGDGGAVVTDNEIFASAIKRLRNYGSDKKYYNEVIGYNSRLDDIQARFLSIKLKYLDKITSHKRKLAKLYHENLKSDFIKPIMHEDYFDVFHIYNIRHPKRDQLKEFLLKKEIKTEIHYPVSPHKQNALKYLFGSQNFPISTEIHNTTLSLPISFAHTEDEIYKVTETLNSF